MFEHVHRPFFQLGSSGAAGGEGSGGGGAAGAGGAGQNAGGAAGGNGGLGGAAGGAGPGGAAAGASGSGGDDWRTTLPAELKDDKTLAQFKTPADAYKALIETKAMVGNSVKVPGATATPAERDAFYEKLGRPKSADEYKLPEKGMPDGVVVDQGLVKAMAGIAHPLGLTGEQFAGLSRGFAGYMHAEAERINAQYAKAQSDQLSALKQELGPAFDERVALANEGLKWAGGDALLAVIRDAGLTVNPALVKAFATVGAALATSEIKGEGARRHLTPTSDEARSALQAFKTGPLAKAVVDPKHPDYARAIETFEKLTAALPANTPPPIL